MKKSRVDWVRKLSSRKFWVAIVGFVSSIMYAKGVAETQVAEVTSIIMAGGTLIAYILAEGWIDASEHQGGNMYPDYEIDEPEDGNDMSLYG